MNKRYTGVADFALVAAKRADYDSNLEYAYTSRNFNPLMALAGPTTAAEAEQIVPVKLIALCDRPNPADPPS